MQPYTQIHTFHVPVMGIGFTLDTPIKIARFGISSAISIMEDNLLEKIREKYSDLFGLSFSPISNKEDDYRAKRITAYLNLVHDIVEKQINELRNSEFLANSDLTKYFQLLPEGSLLRRVYDSMITTDDPHKMGQLKNELKQSLQSGCIDVNIMTKLDRIQKNSLGEEIVDGSDAVTAMRGFVNSNLTNSSVILSAGMNPRLFAYMAGLDAFVPDSDGVFKKKITLKVSNYRSALLQGMVLAKKGLWVSEYRIESGLNCGGHAFATDGYLVGPILEEFRAKRSELGECLFNLILASGRTDNFREFDVPPPIKITYQGGIGNHDENEFLIDHYELDGTGWGSPFLLVPEATTVDDDTLQLLSKANETDVILSDYSPLGIRFNYLKGTTSELEKKARIVQGKPGSPCTEKYLVSNNEFTSEPICTASKSYQTKKIEQLKSLGLDEVEYQRRYDKVVGKECLCVGLSNSAILKLGLKRFKKLESVNICPGPNIVYFSSCMTLKQIVDHIYGRTQLSQINRPHMIVKELSLYIQYWREFLNEASDSFNVKRIKYIKDFYQNLRDGIKYYRDLELNNSTKIKHVARKIEIDLCEAEDKLISLMEGFLSKLLNMVDA